MVWPSLEFELNLLMFLDSLSRSLIVNPSAAPRSAWMAGFLSLAGKSSMVKAGEVLGCGTSLLSRCTSSWTWDSALLSSCEAECCFSRLGSCFCS